VATVHTTYLCARVGYPLLLTNAHKQIVLQGFKYPLREFLMSFNFIGLNSNVAVPRAYTSVATVHTTYLCAWVGCPLLLTSAHKQIVLQGLLPYGSHQYLQNSQTLDYLLTQSTTRCSSQRLTEETNVSLNMRPTSQSS
jgi:hypothetical protein